MPRTLPALLLTCLLPMAALSATPGKPAADTVVAVKPPSAAADNPPSASAAGEPFPDTAAADSSAPAVETCRELAARVRKSDCVRPVARFLDGASVTVGLALTSGQLELSRHDSVKAYLQGFFTPVPYYGFSLPPSYFGGSRWGWEFSFLYTNAVAIYQRFARADNEYRDVGTYASMTFLSVSPSVFLGLGTRDEDPETFVRMGLGTGAGWASVRGTAYFTEDSTRGNLACWEAGDSLATGRFSRSEYRQACALQSYRHSSLGLSVRGFLDARWRFLYFIWDVESVRISSKSMGYAPIELSFKLAWIHDL